MESAEKDHGLKMAMASMQQEIRNLAKVQQTFLVTLQSFLKVAPPQQHPPGNPERSSFNLAEPRSSQKSVHNEIASSSFHRDRQAASSDESVGNELVLMKQQAVSKLSFADSKVLKTLNRLQAEFANLEEERVYLRHKLQMSSNSATELKVKNDREPGSMGNAVAVVLPPGFSNSLPLPPPVRGGPISPAPPSDEPPAVVRGDGGSGMCPVFYVENPEIPLLDQPPHLPSSTNEELNGDHTPPHGHDRHDDDHHDDDDHHNKGKKKPRKSVSARQTKMDARKSKAVTQMNNDHDQIMQIGLEGAECEEQAGVWDFKEQINKSIMKPQLDASRFYKTEGIWQEIARDQVFENVTLSVIAINALWISIDTDLNTADVLLDAHWVFQLVENLFCFYFSFEWIVRFQSFALKKNCLKDAWFVFDSMLVSTMFLETWVMTSAMLLIGGSGSMGGNASLLKMARLLRLSRMARMARLVRAVPELAILIKGMLASMRSVLTTLWLLVILIYIFAIVFVQLTGGGVAITDMKQEGDYVTVAKWDTVLSSMYTLWLYGVLCLDFAEEIVDELMAVTPALALLYYLFILLAPFTVMNMLIGVLCEVVSAVAQSEKEAMKVNFAKTKLEHIMNSLDTDDDGLISKVEFEQLLGSAEACRVLHDIGIDVVGLVEFGEIMFETNEECKGADAENEGIKMSFNEFVDLVLQLRGTTYATVKDIVEVRKLVRGLGKQISEEFALLPEVLAQHKEQLKIEDAVERIGKPTPLERPASLDDQPVHFEAGH